jgi:hypothetical protein
MGILGFIKTLGRAEAERMGFKDGVEGNPVNYVFSQGFTTPETDLSRAYHRGYREGQGAAIPRTLSKVRDVIE